MVVASNNLIHTSPGSSLVRLQVSQLGAVSLHGGNSADLMSVSAFQHPLTCWIGVSPMSRFLSAMVLCVLQGLSPLMFLLALLGNVTYVGRSVLLRCTSSYPGLCCLPCILCCAVGACDWE